jgi:acyl-coenzyme A synthetase/AMP-(fatty) acid ligase
VAITTRGDIAEVLLRSGAAAATALRVGDRTLTYAELRNLVSARSDTLAETIGSPRSGSDDPADQRVVIALTGPPSVEWIVSYLAVLELGHVPLLAGDRHHELDAAWSPRLVIETAPGRVVDRPGVLGGPRPVLHPDLALLLSTSGSTGSPKLVRLSHDNLSSNATAVAASLGLTSRDVGVTSLPLHYCYGLSVLHSHLAVGASVAVVHASVVDPCFVTALARHGVTSLAGVPHTFDLLEAAGPERIATPTLRLLTQAGGRLGVDALARWRSRCASWGVDLVVMYGQTEATARMAVLPSRLAAQAGPCSVGRPVPGGSIEVVPVDGAERLGPDGVGELVFRGPNVMMGYGVQLDDLALGATVEALHTGDLGRFDEASGTFEVVGRRSRFIKPFGLRIDLDRVEQMLRRSHPEAAVGGDDQMLVVVAPGADPGAVAAQMAEATGLPSTAVQVITDRPVPRTAAGKVDHAAVGALAATGQAERTGQPERTGRTGNEAATPSTVLAAVLGRRTIDPGDTFTSVGGDSLSYVEASLRLERIVGNLPDDWQHRTMAELDALAPGAPDHRVDTTVALRAAGICAVVATHMHVLFFPGGAHLLLAVAGYNLSRFQLGIAGARDRMRATTRTVARVAVPTVAVAVAVLMLTDQYGWTTVALVNNYLGPRHHARGHWHFWFIEAFVQLTVVATALLAIPVVRRAERARPYLFVVVLLGGAIALRHVTWWGIDDPFNLRFRTHGVAFFFVLGWLVQRSSTVAQRALTTALCIACIAGFFGQPVREAFVISGLVVLVWARRIRLPRPAVPVVAALASASMWILVSHFHLWPLIAARVPLPAAYPATLLAGTAVWLAVDRSSRGARSVWRSAVGEAPQQRDLGLVVGAPVGVEELVEPHGAGRGPANPAGPREAGLGAPVDETPHVGADTLVVEDLGQRHR